MSSRMKIAVIAVAAAVAIIVTAVGLALVADDSPTQAEYRTAVASARNRTDAALERITQAQSKEELVARMDDAALVVDRAADDLEETGVDARFEATNKRLVAALHQLSTDLEGTAAQIREPDFSDLLQGTRGISFNSWTRVNALLADLRADGIAVPPLERH
jgi:ABC-type enterochelin transport system substrate-binding protein